MLAFVTHARQRAQCLKTALSVALGLHHVRRGMCKVCGGWSDSDPCQDLERYKLCGGAAAYADRWIVKLSRDGDKLGGGFEAGSSVTQLTVFSPIRLTNLLSARHTSPVETVLRRMHPSFSVGKQLSVRKQLPALKPKILVSFQSSRLSSRIS